LGIFDGLFGKRAISYQILTQLQVCRLMLTLGAADHVSLSGQNQSGLCALMLTQQKKLSGVP